MFNDLSVGVFMVFSSVQVLVLFVNVNIKLIWEMVFVNSFYMCVYTWWPFAFLCCACLELWFTWSQDFTFIDSTILLTDFGYYAIAYILPSSINWCRVFIMLYPGLQSSCFMCYLSRIWKYLQESVNGYCSVFLIY